MAHSQPRFNFKPTALIVNRECSITYFVCQFLASLLNFNPVHRSFLHLCCIKPATWDSTVHLSEWGFMTFMHAHMKIHTKNPCSLSSDISGPFPAKPWCVHRLWDQHTRHGTTLNCLGNICMNSCRIKKQSDSQSDFSCKERKNSHWFSYSGDLQNNI